MMDEILALRDKRVQIVESQLNEVLQKHISLIEYWVVEEIQQSNENNVALEEFEAKVAALEKELDFESKVLEEKNREYSKNLSRVKTLEGEKNKFDLEIQNLESQVKKLKIAKPNQHDEQLLQGGRKKFRLYKDLTGIRWDYERLKESVEGYVTNEHDYIHHFSYKNKSDKELSNRLWKMIHDSVAGERDTETDDKETVDRNK